MTDQREGGCRCGELRFRAIGAPLLAAACHCRGCQLMSGSAYSLSSLYPLDRFEVISGTPVRGGLGCGMADHKLCSRCMSWVFTLFEGGPLFANVRSTSFDEPSDRPFVDNYLSEKLPFAETGAPHRYDEFMPEGDFERILSEYANWKAET